MTTLLNILKKILNPVTQRFMMNFAFFGTNNQKIIYSPTYVMVDKATALQIAKENPEAHFIAAPEETDNGTDKASITPES